MNYKIFTILALLFLCASPVAAVTYSEEYYTFGAITNVSWDKISGAYYGIGQDNPTAQYLTVLELRRQTILLEKQNELLMEQIKAQWVTACYSQENIVVMGNHSAWKSECVNAGYPVG